MTAMTKINHIKIRHIFDDSPDLSYLTDESRYAGESPEDIEKYKAQDAECLAAYNNDDWYCIGIKAEAEIATSQDGGKNWLLNTISSGGIWGIESDSDEAYMKEEANNQLEELREVLLLLGFMSEQIYEAQKNAETVEG